MYGYGDEADIGCWIWVLGLGLVFFGGEMRNGLLVYEEMAEKEWQWLLDVGAVVLLVDFFIRFVGSF